MLLRVLRIFRILRILRLLKGAKGLKDLIMTMVLSFPSLVNVVSLLLLIVFIYAVLGVNLFTYLAFGAHYTDERNFVNIGNAFLVLFQCITGDGWAGLMMDGMMDEASGQCTIAEGNCGTPAALPYFLSFQIIACFIFLNLIVAVMLDNFTSLGSQNPDLVSAADIAHFTEAWADFDPDADQLIPMDDLPQLVAQLPPPMGTKGVGRRGSSELRHALRMCMHLQVAQHEGEVRFEEVIDALVRLSSSSLPGFSPPDASAFTSTNLEIPLLSEAPPSARSRTPVSELLLQARLTPQQVTELESSLPKRFAKALCASIYREYRAARDANPAHRRPRSRNRARGDGAAAPTAAAPPTATPAAAPAAPAATPAPVVVPPPAAKTAVVDSPLQGGVGGPTSPASSSAASGSPGRISRIRSGWSWKERPARDSGSGSRKAEHQRQPPPADDDPFSA